MLITCLVCWKSVRNTVARVVGWRPIEGCVCSWLAVIGSAWGKQRSIVVCRGVGSAL